MKDDGFSKINNQWFTPSHYGMDMFGPLVIKEEKKEGQYCSQQVQQCILKLKTHVWHFFLSQNWHTLFQDNDNDKV